MSDLLDRMISDKSPVTHKQFSQSLVDEEEARDMTREEEAVMSKAVVSLYDIYPSVVEYKRVDRARICGSSTGWHALDELFRVARGELTLVTGIPGHRKSAFVNALSMLLAVNEDWGWIVFAPENWSRAHYFSRLISLFSGKPFFDFVDGAVNEDEFMDASMFISRRFSLVNTSTSGIDIDSLINRFYYTMREHEKKGGMRQIKGIIIDPWNQVEHCRAQGENEHEYIGRCLVKLINFCRKNMISVFLVAHPRKMEVGNDHKISPPHPYHVSGSANWFNMVDNALTIWANRDADNGEITDRATIITRKIKVEFRGKVSQADLWFDRRNGRFCDYESQLSHDDQAYQQQGVEDVKLCGAEEDGVDSVTRNGDQEPGTADRQPENQIEPGGTAGIPSGIETIPF